MNYYSKYEGGGFLIDDLNVSDRFIISLLTSCVVLHYICLLLNDVFELVLSNRLDRPWGHVRQRGVRASLTDNEIWIEQEVES